MSALVDKSKAFYNGVDGARSVSRITRSGVHSQSRISKFCKRACIDSKTRPNGSACNSCNVDFYTTNGAVDASVLQRGGACEYQSNAIILCGTTNPSPTLGAGLVYVGDIKTTVTDLSNQVFSFLVPGSAYTSCYGPRYDASTDTVTLVGSYNMPNSANTYGFCTGDRC